MIKKGGPVAALSDLDWDIVIGRGCAGIILGRGLVICGAGEFGFAGGSGAGLLTAAIATSAKKLHIGALHLKGLTGLAVAVGPFLKAQATLDVNLSPF